MLRLLGDIHGKWGQYLEIVRNCEATVQLGDMGFKETYKALEKHADPNRHKFLSGNHDDADYLRDPGLAHNIGNYGEFTHGGHTFFFCRGAFSIDVRYRLKQEQLYGIKSWWPEEELSYSELDRAIQLYATIKPELVLTHDCPHSLADIVGNADIVRSFGFEVPLRTRTQMALQAMFEAWQPKMWVHGHFHKSFRHKVNRTEFICLNELEYMDI